MFEYVTEFESQIADFFGSPYAVATDCCTHAIELCLRYTNSNNLVIPSRTYVSIPMTFMKLGLKWSWCDEEWEDSYRIDNSNIIDGAVLWGEGVYERGSFTCLSFQFKKHLNLGRGGMILLEDRDDRDALKKMSYDGRDLSRPWAEQDITSIGYHYYMTPEVAKIGIELLKSRKKSPAKKWTARDYPDLKEMSVFK
jgi:dTDP-4-amino-4,6-dideoxygalactose transaminase